MSEKECLHLNQIYEATKKELIELASKHQELLTEIEELQQTLATTKLKLMEKSEQYEADKSKYEKQIFKSSETERSLQVQVTFIVYVKLLFLARSLKRYFFKDRNFDGRKRLSKATTRRYDESIKNKIRL